MSNSFDPDLTLYVGPDLDLNSLQSRWLEPTIVQLEVFFSSDYLGVMSPLICYLNSKLELNLSCVKGFMGTWCIN